MTTDERIIEILERRLAGTRFRACPGISEFYVSDMGDVFTTRKPTPTSKESEEFVEDGTYLRRPHVSRGNGYCYVAIGRAIGRNCIQVHRLVLEAFVGPCPEGMEACHWPESIRSNNRLSNLRWDTRPANKIDMINDKMSTFGAKNPQAKMTDEHVKKAIILRAAGKTLKQIAEEFGVTRSAVSRAIHGDGWKHINRTGLPSIAHMKAIPKSQNGSKNTSAKIDESSVREIRRLRDTGLTLGSIAGIFGISVSNVSLIAKRATWTHI
jgi:hypothetical protein